MRQNLLGAFVVGFVLACARTGIKTPAAVVGHSCRKAAALVAGAAAAGMRFLRTQIDGVGLQDDILARESSMPSPTTWEGPRCRR